MNFNKDPRHAQKLAREQKALRKKAKKVNLQGKEAAICSWSVELDNYTEPVKAVRQFVKDEEDEYADYA